ncbi:MAG: prephenate dehydrogenase/arogenate dehydrogenase family protein [Calditrichaeota bacterium]|nr:prephenate dehydrogenase/arogenate dehydrogenase family protein [Calditrichota bacterium]
MARARFIIIGGGRVGRVLAYHLLQAGHRVMGIVETHPARATELKALFPEVPVEDAIPEDGLSQCDCLLICVPDDQITEVVKTLIPHKTHLQRQIIVHTSGSVPSAVLSPLRHRSVQCVSAHPISSFSTLHPSTQSLQHVFFDLEGDPEGVQWFSRIVADLGGRALSVTIEQKKAIHLAAVFYSNFFLGLAAAAQDILQQQGFPSEHRFQPFLPLIQATLSNLEQQPPLQALTGPLKRGDVSTIQTHLDLLKRHAPEWLPLYREICRALLPKLDLPEDKKHRLKQLLG